MQLFNYQELTHKIKGKLGLHFLDPNNSFNKIWSHQT